MGMLLWMTMIPSFAQLFNHKKLTGAPWWMSKRILKIVVKYLHLARVVLTASFGKTNWQMALDEIAYLPFSLTASWMICHMFKGSSSIVSQRTLPNSSHVQLRLWSREHHCKGSTNRRLWNLPCGRRCCLDRSKSLMPLRFSRILGCWSDTNTDGNKGTFLLRLCRHSKEGLRTTPLLDRQEWMSRIPDVGSKD